MVEYDEFDEFNSVLPNSNIHITDYKFNFAEQSEWVCHMFGSNGNGISWRPLKGHEPNWFWRKLQYLCFGNRWIKE